MDEQEAWSEIYRTSGEKWADCEGAASILEETKSAVLAQMMSKLGDIPVSHAEKQAKASDEWLEFVTKMVKARQAANLAKINLEYAKLKFMEWNSANATRRVEMRL